MVESNSSNLLFIIRICVIITVISSYILSEYALGVNILIADGLLLFGLTDKDAEQIMNGGTDGGTLVFYSMERWNSNLRPGRRLAWVQVWGIPPQAWTTKHIQQITAVVGDMIDMDDEVEEKRRLDRARVLVRTPWRPTIQHTIDVFIGELRMRSSDSIFSIEVGDMHSR